MEALHHHKQVHVYDDALRTPTNHLASLPDDINMVTVADTASEGLWEHIVTNSDTTWLHPQYGAEKSPSACQTLLSAYMCNGLCVYVCERRSSVSQSMWVCVAPCQRISRGRVCLLQRKRETEGD